MKMNLMALLLILVLPFSFASANDEEEQEDYSKRQIYNNSCFVGNNPAGALDEGTKGAIGCPPGRSQIFGRAVNAAGRRNNAMTCPLFGADYYFFSHVDGKCYKYETTVNNKLEAQGGRWICYSKDSNDCD